MLTTLALAASCIWASSANASTYYWYYSYPGCGNSTVNCWSVNTNPGAGTNWGTVNVNDTGASGFIPSGDFSGVCQHGSGDPSCGGSCPGNSYCGGNEAWPTGGDWCRDYGTGGGTQSACSVSGDLWTLAPGYYDHNECPTSDLLCATHHVIGLDCNGCNNSTDHPWDSTQFNSNAALWFGGYQDYVATDATSSGFPSNWHGYLCVEISPYNATTAQYGGWIEDCGETWRSQSKSSWPFGWHQVNCMRAGAGATLYTQLGDDSTNRYMYSVGHAMEWGTTLNSDQDYAWAISRTQLSNAVSDTNSSCGTHYATDSASLDKYRIWAFESGAEGSGTKGGGDPNAYLALYTYGEVASTSY